MTPNELVLPDPNPDAAPVLGDGCSAPCPDEVVVPDEGAMGGDSSMAISQGTVFSFSAMNCLVQLKMCRNSKIPCLLYALFTIDNTPGKK